MKQLILVTLICFNAALIVALVAGPAAPKANAQVLGANFLVVTGNIDDNTDAVYILDLANRRLSGLKMERKDVMGIGPAGGRDLLRDFGRTGRR